MLDATEKRATNIAMTLIVSLLHHCTSSSALHFSLGLQQKH
jgi:hypothetical protein